MYGVSNMSNPAVVSLFKEKIDNVTLWIDDNIGESVHIHLDNIRLDYSIKEYKELTEQLAGIIDSRVNVEGFKCSNFNSVCLSNDLWAAIPYIKSVSIENIKLEGLLTFERWFFGKFKKYHSIKESKLLYAFQAMQNSIKYDSQSEIDKLNSILDNYGDNRYPYGHKKAKLISQLENERIVSIYNSIKDNGYPYNKEHIVIFGDDNRIIRDGLHRAACLYVLYGNIDVPVMSLYLDEAYFHAHGTPTGYLLQLKRKWYNLKNIHSRKAISMLTSLLRVVKNSCVKIAEKVFILMHKREINKIERIFYYGGKNAEN